MPPQLLHRRPVGVRAKRTGAHQEKLCQCQTCSLEQVIDPNTGKSIPGKLCSRAEYQLHRRQMKAQLLLRGPIVTSQEPRLQPSSPPIKELPTSLLRRDEELKPKIRGLHKRGALFKVQDMLSEFNERHTALRTLPTGDLIFVRPPSPESALHSAVRSDPRALAVNTGPYALEPGRGANQQLLEYESWLIRTVEEVESIQSEGCKAVLSSKLHLLQLVHVDLETLEDMKAKEWLRRYRRAVKTRTLMTGLEKHVVDTSRYLIGPLLMETPLQFTSYLLIVILHVICNVSLDSCAFIVHGIRLLLEQAWDMTGAAGTNRLLSAIDLPTDVRRMVDQLDLKPVFRGYACCPKCFCCYDSDTFPEFCQNKTAKDSGICGRRLQVTAPANPRRHDKGPSRRYLAHDLNHWIGRLLCRRDMEEYIDRDVLDTGSAEGELRDMWDGTMLKDFKGPDGLRFVRKLPHGEARLIFGLNMDSFNPFMNKHRGPSVSCGAIYMVCMNLPPEVRYRMENIFLVGIIPGPTHPTLCEMNHLLQYLVDDLVRLWYQGVYCTRTALRRSGRLVRCALVPVICYLPAARQIMAYASHSMRLFCCYCGLERDSMEELDMSQWPPGIQSREEWVRLATQWRDASSKEREKLFSSNGIRYSELLRLPYWNPLEHVVIDTMHAFFLTELHHHCRTLWGMDVKVAEGTDMGRKTPKRPSETQMLEAWDTVRRGTNKDLGRLTNAALFHLNRDLELASGGHKTKLVNQLKDYRRRHGIVDQDGNPINPRAQKWENQNHTQDDINKAHRTFKHAPTAQKLASRLNASLLKTYAVLLSKENEGLHVDTSGKKLDVATQLIEWRSRQYPDYTPTSSTASEISHTSSGVSSSLTSSYAPTTASNLSETTSISFDSPLYEPHQSPDIIAKDSDSLVPPQVPPPQHIGTIMGRVTLSKIHDDIQKTVLPTWIDRVPSNLGSASCRSLSADMWRTACTVNLVVSLVRLWGPCDEESREYRMLENFMDLVAAVKLASRRVLTEQTINKYQHHMMRYLKGCLQLYPEYGLHPYHHLSLHLPQFLRAYGPTQSWRCFAFERYNHRLQEINTNGKFGDLEATLFETFCVGQNLRALMLGGVLSSPVVERLRPFFLSRLADDARGTLIRDICETNVDHGIQYKNKTRRRPLDPMIISLLRIKLGGITAPRRLDQETVLHQTSITWNGTKLSTKSRSLGDSQVVFIGADGRYAAGRICDIFLWPKRTVAEEDELDPFLVVEPLRDLTQEDRQHDHYWHFDHAGRLFYAKPADIPIVLSLDEVLCHFAGTPYKSKSTAEDSKLTAEDYLHVLPLDR